MVARFVQTDQVSEITDVQRDLAAVHEGDDAFEHVCEGCAAVDADHCWHRRHGLGAPPENTEVRRLEDRRPGECQCMCHHLVDQCLMAQAAGDSEGRPMYRLESTTDEWSVVMPKNVYEQFQEMPAEVQQEAMERMLEHARRQASRSTPDPK